MKPLNGTKTHPLSEYALERLREIGQRPRPSMSLNPGVIDRLLRGELVEIVQLPSPFKKHDGKNCSHLKITEAGLKLIDPAPKQE